MFEPIADDAEGHDFWVLAEEAARMETAEQRAHRMREDSEFDRFMDALE